MQHVKSILIMLTQNQQYLLWFLFSQNQIELVKSHGPYHMGKILMSHMYNQSFDHDTVYKA